LGSAGIISTERTIDIGGRIAFGVFALAGGAFLIAKKKKSRKQVYITKEIAMTKEDVNLFLKNSYYFILYENTHCI
jgi:hypothetical protein